MNDNDELIIYKEPDKEPRWKTYTEIRAEIRKELLQKLIEIFDNSLNKEWHNFEVADFLRSLLNKE